jgi:hypothetical protein
MGVETASAANASTETAGSLLLLLIAAVLAVWLALLAAVPETSGSRGRIGPSSGQ